MSKVIDIINKRNLEGKNIIIPKIGSRVKVTYTTLTGSKKIKEGVVIGGKNSGITSTIRVLYPDQLPSLRLVEQLQVYSPYISLEVLQNTNRKLRAKLNYLIEKTPKEVAFRTRSK